MQRPYVALLGLMIALSLSACTAPRPAGTPAPGPGASTPAPAAPSPTAAPATVSLAQRQGDRWLPVTPLAAVAPPGPAELRLAFSKPVRREEVEQALLAAQAAPVRGLMTWLDDQTLIWQIQSLPARLDFLLGGAHDQDGLPLPGGIPSLRLGQMPVLVTLDPAHPGDEKAIATLPADIATARLEPGGQAVTLQVWQPGTTRWDWTLVQFAADLRGGQVVSGPVGEARPRAAADLEEWAISPSGALVAGLKTDGDLIAKTVPVSLVVSDLAGGRRVVTPEFIRRNAAASEGDSTVHLAWSPDSTTVAALTYKGATSDLIAFSVADQRRTTLLPDVPVQAGGTVLRWSANPRYLLAGHLIIDLQAHTTRALERSEGQPSGEWSPDGAWLAYQPAAWGPILLVDPATGSATPAGTGLLVGWTPEKRLCVIRWTGNETRYHPLGMK